jgi:plasmid maintenance system antidote protein VapI
MARMYNPYHPGEVLQDYLEGRNTTEYAAQIGLTEAALTSLLQGEASVTPELSSRLSQSLGQPNCSG